MTTTELSTIPPLGGLYAKAALAGVLPGGGDHLPDASLVVRDVAIDRAHLADYAEVCGFRLCDRLPATYVHVLAFPLSVALMADRRFPFALPGLVHIANRIEVRRPVTADERLDLTVRAADLRPHRKGQQFDVLAEATIDGRVVWTGASTYLRRGGGGDHTPAAGQGGADVEPPLPAPSEDVETARWRVPTDTGRRYGAASGDRNPIHLTSLTARPFGFPGPIAHGMWTAARCEAALEGRLPDAATHTVSFGKPLLLGRTVTFGAVEHDEGWAFAVRDRRSGAPHLTGDVR